MREVKKTDMVGEGVCGTQRKRKEWWGGEEKEMDNIFKNHMEEEEGEGREGENTSRTQHTCKLHQYNYISILTQHLFLADLQMFTYYQYCSNCTNLQPLFLYSLCAFVYCQLDVIILYLSYHIYLSHLLISFRVIIILSVSMLCHLVRFFSFGFFPEVFPNVGFPLGFSPGGCWQQPPKFTKSFITIVVASALIHLHYNIDLYQNYH